jgi:6-phosphogluconolactonase
MLRKSLGVLICTLVASCGGGGGGGGGGGAAATFTVGGSVTGLAGTGLVLRNNGGDDLNVTGNGAFTFPTSVASGAAYTVTVHAQPVATPAQICEVSAGGGTVTDRHVTTVLVTCRAMTGEFAYVANTGSQTVSAFSIDVDTGALTELVGSPFAVNGDAPFLPFQDLSGNYLYILGDDTLGVINSGPSTLTGYAVDGSGALTPIPGMPIAYPVGPWNPRFHPGGRFLYITSSENTADAGNGLHVYSIDAATGELTSVPGSPYELGAAGDHMLRPGMTGPSGEFLYVPHGSVYADEIAVYAVDTVTGALTLQETVPLGKPVNQLVVHPAGDFVYTRNADETIGILAIDPVTGQLSAPTFVPGALGLGISYALDGRFMYFVDFGYVGPSTPGPGQVRGFEVDSATGGLTALPQSPYATGGNTAAAMVTDPTDRYVAATNADSGTFAIFEIDPADGSLSHVPGSPFSPAVGNSPGGVWYDPSGRFVYLAETAAAGSVSSYQVDEETGVPTFVGSHPTGVGTSGANIAIVGLQ